jgi:serine/threonine protein kinase
MATGIHPFKNNNDYLKDKLNKSFNLDFSEMDEDKIIKDNVINKKLDFNVFKNYGLRLLAQHLLDRDPKERYSAMEAFNELNKIKTGTCLNKKISRTLNKSPMKVIKEQKIHETPSNKNVKYSAKSSFGKFKGIFKDINYELNDDNKNEEDKKSGDSEKEKKDKDKNKKKDNNEIRIFIKKKNRKNK